MSDVSDVSDVIDVLLSRLEFAGWLSLVEQTAGTGYGPRHRCLCKWKPCREYDIVNRGGCMLSAPSAFEPK